MWFVVAIPTTAAPAGATRVRREFDSLVAARAWEIGMTSLGYLTSQPQPVLKRVA